MPLFNRHEEPPTQDPDVVFLADVRQRLIDIVDDIDGYISAATPPSDPSQNSDEGIGEEETNDQ